MTSKKNFFLLILLLCINYASAQQFELKSISFEGNNEISDSRLESVILSSESPMWFFKFLNSFSGLGAEAIMFDSTKIPFDLAALYEYYRNYGYFETIITYRYELDTADLNAELIYSINEGERSKFRSIHFAGLENLLPQTYVSIIGEFNNTYNEWYNQALIEKNINASINILRNSGYLNAKFDSTLIFRDTSANAADLNIFISKANQVTIDTILINKKGEGANLVSEDLLSKITGIKTGSYYNQDEIKRSQIRLYRTGLFNSVVLTPVQADINSKSVTLQVDGTIGYIHELSPEIIVNNQQSAFNVGLGANFIKKNFFGEARKLTLSASFGIQDIFNVDFKNLIKQFSFRDTTLLGYVDSRAIIEQPFLFGKPIFGTWETYANIRKQKDYNITSYGSKISFDFELPKFTFINYLSTYYSIEQTKEVYRTFNDSLSKKLVSTIGIDLGNSSTDDFLFPTQGNNLSLQIEEANGIPYLVSSLFGWNYSGTVFYKLLFTSSTYLALDAKRNNIFAIKFKTGHIQPYVGDYASLPLNRTFYAGGSNSVRGWRSNQLVPPTAPVYISTNRTALNVKGGTFLLEGTLEYRYRVLPSIGIVGFFDYGNTWINYKDFNLPELALAAGLGLRYYTQVAPFRIDFGFKFYDPQDRGYIFDKIFWKNLEFHFGIGEAF